jgi:hypothetical protein
MDSFERTEAGKNPPRRPRLSGAEDEHTHLSARYPTPGKRAFAKYGLDQNSSNLHSDLQGLK